MRNQTSDSLDRYFKSIDELNPLSKAEELELARKAKDGSERSLNKLVEHNLKIVVTIANRNRGRGILVDDLIQQGNLGLLDAFKRFDPDVGVRFATFAATTVLKFMNYLIDTCGRIVRIPVNQEYDRYKAKKAGKDVANIASVKIDDFIGDDEGETKGSRILAVRPEIEIEYEQNDFKIKVKSLLGILKERDRDIVKLYYGIDTQEDAMPTKEIATEVGLTQIRVCQILSSAKKKLQTQI